MGDIDVRIQREIARENLRAAQGAGAALNSILKAVDETLTKLERLYDAVEHLETWTMTMVRLGIDFPDDLSDEATHVVDRLERQTTELHTKVMELAAKVGELA